MTSFLKAHALRVGKFVALVSTSGGGLLCAYGFSSLIAKEKPGREAASRFMCEPVTSQDQLESTSGDMKTRMEVMIMKMQREVCDELSRLDGSAFVIDKWERKGGGGGITCVIQDGTCLLPRFLGFPDWK